MSDTITTTPRTVVAVCLPVHPDCPDVMPGDTVHLEVTLKVTGVKNALDYRDNPRVLIDLDSIEGSPAVYRVSGMKGVTIPAPRSPEPPMTVLEAAEPPLSRSDRIRAWWSRTRLDRLTTAAVLGFTAWVACIALLAVSLTACGGGYERVGDVCPKVGATGYAKGGGTLLCRTATDANIKAGDTAPRWRRA